MPFYEYRCGSCGHEFEAMQKMNDALLTDCPACNKAELVKLVSAAGFRLKGGGWYETDFKGGNKAKSGDSTGKDTGDKAGKETTDTAAKGASGSATKEASGTKSSSTASSAPGN